MEEFDEMARELLAERVKSIRDAWNKKHSGMEMAAHVKQMDAILRSLPDREREWLDRHLTDGLELSEEECTALYVAGLKDGLRLLKLL